MQRVKLFQLAPGVQCVAERDNERVAQKKSLGFKAGFKLIPIIRYVVYLEMELKGEYINLANKIGFETPEGRDHAFTEIKENDIIGRYNSAITNNNWGLTPLPLLKTKKAKNDESKKSNP